MSNESLALAKAAYRRGSFLEAHALARQASVKNRAEREERDCLVCDCIQYSGAFAEAEELATAALKRELSPDQAARYWEVLGRIRLDQLRHDEATEV